MRSLLWLFPVLALLTSLATILSTPASAATTPQPQGPQAIHGEWIYVEDRTDGRPAEQHQPSMSARLTLRVEDDAVVLLRSGGREIRMPLDGSPTEVAFDNSTSNYSGQWKDGAFHYQSDPVRQPGDTRAGGVIRWELRPTPDGLLAGVTTDSGWASLALYRHPQDIPLPAPAKASIADVAWIAGNWAATRGTSGTTSIEERWSPPLAGSMLAVSRTVSRDRLRAFEYLRILERDAGLVYIAQPNGRTPTEFVLTEIAPNRAVFENPRHDSPQRIVYELSADGGLTASIGYARGGRPQQLAFKRADN
jgi:hypothetical protein